MRNAAVSVDCMPTARWLSKLCALDRHLRVAKNDDRFCADALGRFL